MKKTVIVLNGSLGIIHTLISIKYVLKINLESKFVLVTRVSKMNFFSKFLE